MEAGVVTPTRNARWVLLVDAIALTVIAAVIRLVPLATTDFPVHDGGMFLAIIGDIRTHGMSLPDHISYNGGVIPFDYPPLAFWIAAWSPLDPITALRVIPFVASTLTVPVFFFIARAIRPDDRVAFIASLIFAATPHSWEWLVTGGGLTRATGMLAAMVAIWQLLRAYSGGSPANAVVAGIASGLTVLTHPEASVFLAFSGLLISVAFIRRRRELGRMVLAAAVAFVVVLPWVAYLALNGRLVETLSAGGTGFDVAATLFRLITLDLTDEATAPVALFLGVVGVLVLLRERHWLVPAWIGAELVLAARGAPNYAMIPLCIAAGVGLQDGVVGSLLRLRPDSTAWRRASQATLGLAVFWLFLNVPLLASDRTPPFDALSTQQRDGMAWIRANTAADARLVEVTGMLWATDYVAEWAPALTDRVSLTTMQGYEWLGATTWQERLAKVEALQDCTLEDAACVDAWLRANAAGAEIYVLVPNADASRSVLLSVAGSPRFKVVWREQDLLVARWVGP